MFIDFLPSTSALVFFFIGLQLQKTHWHLFLFSCQVCLNVSVCFFTPAHITFSFKFKYLQYSRSVFSPRCCSGLMGRGGLISSSGRFFLTLNSWWEGVGPCTFPVRWRPINHCKRFSSGSCRITVDRLTRGEGGKARPLLLCLRPADAQCASLSSRRSLTQRQTSW